MVREEGKGISKNTLSFSRPFFSSLQSDGQKSQYNSTNRLL